MISADDATPGYLPGELEPGTWQVIIGIYRLPIEGIAYRLTTTTTDARSGLQTDPGRRFAARAADPPPRRELPAAAGRRWLGGDLHAHTVHSDGVLTVPELACLAAESGLDFLAVTDHNTVSHHPELAASAARYAITLLPGQEVTADTGHAGVLGDVGWVDFRGPADGWLTHARQRGGIMSVNHPIAGHVSWLQLDARPPAAR